MRKAMAYKIVSVEDDPQIAELLQFVLQHDNLKVDFAHDGVTGLKLIRRIQPDLILLDVMLPEMNGWQVYDAIRADERLRPIPVIMVSVLSEIRERKEAFAASTIDSYFTKPFDTRRLRGEIEQMLGATLWDMPPLPPVRPASEGDGLISPVLTDLFQAGTPGESQGVAQKSETQKAEAQQGAAQQGAAQNDKTQKNNVPEDLDDTQPALPLRPMRPSRPARRTDPGEGPKADRKADNAQADPAAQQGESSGDT
jgi:two-component system response regulator VicR